MANTIFTQTITCLAVGTFGRCPPSNVDHQPIHHLRFNSRIKHKRFSVQEKNLALGFQNDARRKMNMVVCSSITPGNPVDPSPGNFGSLAQYSQYLHPFRGANGDLSETTIDEAQRVVDIIEDVAEGVEKVAEEVVKHLPEGKFRDAVEFVEKVAEDVDKQAQHAEDALEKVENMEKELESFVIESTTHQESTGTTNSEAKE
ncbi:unnamed protein product [Sphenostylis stenocarpa]|uniref:Uncharacterized protein n=1 Tax=Sphenostylis stenocarpa TaxID=92480 RepID=A0AA86SSD1_9FABA|nr:unnamed protein product [Sphenostylis stenocarpa]